MLAGHYHSKKPTPREKQVRVPSNFIEQLGTRYCFQVKGNTEAAVITTVTSKGQVTIPKRVREAAGIKPGDKVVVRATAAGGVYVGHPDKASEYEIMAARLGQAPDHPRRHDHRRFYGIQPW